MSRRRLDLTGGSAARERPDPAEARHTKIDYCADTQVTPAAASIGQPMATVLPDGSRLPSANVSVDSGTPAGTKDSPPIPAGVGPGGYVKRHQVHRGHLTSVWLASNPRRSGQWFALKFINPEYLYNKILQERFEQEATIGAAIKNPHMARVVEFGRDANGPWLAMDYVSGPFDRDVVGTDWPRDLPPPPLTLDEHVRKHGTVPAEKVLDFGIKLCLAVEACHAAGIVHADIRPDNVLCNAQRQPILIDLGLCRPISAPDRMFLPTDRMINAYYASSELKSNVDCHDPRADIFALAGTLVFALTKRTPWHCAPESLPEELRPVLVKALETNPDGRFPTAAAFGLALAGPARPASARPVGPPSAGSSVKIIKRGSSANQPPSSSIKKLRRL